MSRAAEMGAVADRCPEDLLLGGGAANPYTVAVSDRWETVADGWEEAARSGAATPFQQRHWLDAWYATRGREPGVSPCIVTVHAGDGRGWALRLPLIRRRMKGLTSLEFADLDLTDYNAPLLGPAAPRDPAGAKAVWRAVRRALSGVDLVSFRKMPAVIAGAPNPLALLPGAWTSSLNGNVVGMGDDWDAYRHSRGKTVRKELERSWRVFTRHPLAAFKAVSDPAEAAAAMAVMEAQQVARMREAGLDYRLDEPTAAAFYRRLVEEGLSSGRAVLTTLVAGEEVVACLLGIRDRDSYTMIRISNAGEAWANCSPGRLIIERSMAWLHGQGVRTFDFSIGNYAYKRRFGVAPVPLKDYVAALTWCGLPIMAKAASGAWLRERPALDAMVRRAVGKPA